MPELYFKGKEFVYNHHLTVPYRPLEPVLEKSVDVGAYCNTPLQSGNLIIHGDNLHALKALGHQRLEGMEVVAVDDQIAAL